MKKTEELDLQYYINLAAAQKGKTFDLEFQARGRKDMAGTYTILSFEEADPHFTYGICGRGTRDPEDGDDEPSGAKLGIYTIKLNETKFYKNRILRCEVSACVQTEFWGETDWLVIRDKDLTTGKFLKAYTFPIVDPDE